MKKRIFYAIFSSCLSLLFISNLFLFFTLETFFTQRIFEELKKEALLLTQFKNNLLSLEQENSAKTYRVSLINQQGKVLYDNASTQTLDNDREEFIQAMQNGESFGSRFSQTLNQHFLYYATKIEIDNQPYILRISTAKNDVFSLLSSIAPWIFLEFLVCLFACLFLAKHLANSILAPICNINIKNLKKDFVYAELHSFIDQIKLQNKTIKTQFKKLKQKQKELLILTENMSDGLILINHKGKIISSNQATLKILENLENYSYIQEIDQVHLLEKIQTLLHLFQQNQSCNHIAYITLNQQEYETTFSPIYRKGKLRGMIVILRDLSQKEELQKLRKEFSANVTHELKTPLTSILVTSEMIRNQIIHPKDTPHFIDKIYQESKRLLEMIEEILKLTFLDECGNSKPKENIDLKQVAEEVISSLDTLAKEKNISFVLDLDSCLILGTRRLIENLIYNLCDNAIKYNHHGGFVKISIKSSQEGIKLSVKDNGIGIPKQEQNRIFERFYRVNKSRSKQFGGTGLGLSIVKSIVLYHQATIQVFSQENQGSEFCIIFPNHK